MDHWRAVQKMSDFAHFLGCGLAVGIYLVINSHYIFTSNVRIHYVNLSFSYYYWWKADSVFFLPLLPPLLLLSRCPDRAIVIIVFFLLLFIAACPQSHTLVSTASIGNACAVQLGTIVHALIRQVFSKCPGTDRLFEKRPVFFISIARNRFRLKDSDNILPAFIHPGSIWLSNRLLGTLHCDKC